MNPTIRYLIRCFFAGMAAFLTSLQSNLPGISLDELLEAGIAGGIFALAYAGLGAVTPIEPKIGVKKA